MPLDNIDELLQKVKDAGGQVKVDPDGNLHTKWLYGENKALRAQMRAHKPRIIAKLAPNLLQIRLNKAKSLSDNLYDNYKAAQRVIQSGNEAVNEEVQNIPERGISNVPGLPMFGKDIAPKVLKALFPESVTGKVLSVAAPLISKYGEGAGALKRAATGIGIGAGAGEVSGEGAGTGALQGAMTVPAELVQIPNEVQAVKDLANKFEAVSNDAKEAMGKTFAQIIGHPYVSAQLAKGRNIVDVLLDANTQDKIGDRFGSEVRAVADDLQQRADNAAQQKIAAFKSKYGFAPGGKPPEGFQANRQILKEYKEAKQALTDARTIKKDFNRFRQGQSVARAGSYGAKGLPSTSMTGRRAQQQYRNLSEAVRARVSKWGQDLTDRLDAADAGYSQFQGLKDLVRVKGIRNDRGDIDLREAQRVLRDYPESFQRKLKDAWPLVKDTVRRYALDEGSIDMPGVMRRGSQPMRMHVSESGNMGIIGNIMNLISTRDKSVMSHYIGQTPKVVRNFPKGAYTGAEEAVNSAVDYLRRPPQMLEKKNNPEEIKSATP